VKIVSFCSLIYVDRVLFNKISFYENHKCPCVASAKCLCPETEIYAFSFENTRMLTCCHLCIRITSTVQVGRLCFVELFEKGSGILRRISVSYSKMLGISVFGALERTHCWKSVDVVVVKHYDLGKIREFYVTSGFSSGTHNSCKLICLRFNPVKMSK